MKRRKDAESSELSRTFCSTCSHRTASAADPGAFAMARRATRDTDASTLSIAIEPARSSPRSVRRSTTTLTSSLTTSARTTSPSGSIAAPGRWTTFVTNPKLRSGARTSATSDAGTTRRSPVTQRL